ncbi:heparin lyase I family protein [Amycolatopsis jejuensis]|uniref:heparin lyase I family protein n=1 Tax=Amycolatopsis jejuensis TaxID=330084 RepID=UPI0006921F50|nr:heparin lyase I family protein [Amycolatopsis jejuensis]
MRKISACLAAVVAAVALTGAAAPQQVTWSADPAEGTGQFRSIQCADGKFRTTADPQKGRVWVATQLTGEERCEAVGPDLAAGSTYYLGWSAKFRIADSTSRYLFQLKCSPSSDTANHPVVLKVSDGQLKLEEWTTGHEMVPLWQTRAKNDEWHEFAFRISSGRHDGTIRFWFDGVRQTFADGSTTYTGTTFDGTRNYLKWGLYHQAPETATQWLSTIRMGSSLADVTG